jgi:hypothetical protein
LKNFFRFVWLYPFVHHHQILIAGGFANVEIQFDGFLREQLGQQDTGG